jgi:hypothetical protein
MEIEITAGPAAVTALIDGKIIAVYTEESFDTRTDGLNWENHDPSWETFVGVMYELGHSVDPKIRPLWSWEPDKWARAYVKAHGRQALEAEINVIARQNHLAALVLAGKNQLQRVVK